MRYCLVPLILCLSLTSFAQTKNEIRPLVPGQPVEREIAGGESHTFQITLQAGQLLRVVTEPKAIDVVLVLVSPDGKQLREANLTGAGGREALSAEAAVSGDYRLTVSVAGAATLTGSYQVRLDVKAAATAEDKQRMTAELLMIEANDLGKQGAKTNPQVIEKLEQTLALWRELGDPFWTASSLYRIGSAYENVNLYEKAIEYYERALVSYREVKSRNAEAATLYAIGVCHGRLGRYEKTIENVEQALVVYREVKDRAGEGMALGGLAVAHTLLSQYDKALAYQEQALPIYREVKDRRGEGLVLNNIGATYFWLGRYEKAIEYVEQALVISREMKNKLREAAALQSLAGAFEMLGNNEKAIEYLDQALPIAREVKSPWVETFVLNALGYAYLTLKRYDKSIEYYQQAITTARAIKARGLETEPLDYLGNAYRFRGQYETATSYHEQALAVARETKTRQFEASSLKNLMLDWKARNRPSLGVFFGKQAVNLIQEIRGEIAKLDHETQQSFLKSNEEAYRNLADLLIAQGRLPEAEQVIRMLKEEEYFEYIRRDSANAPQGQKAQLTPEEAAIDKRYREIADQLAVIGTERGTLMEKKARTPDEEQRLAKLDADLVIAGNAFQKFLTQLEVDLGTSSEANAKAFALRESQGLMEDLRELGKGTVALYTLVGEDKYRVILTTADFQKGYEYPIKAAELNRKVLEFREALQNPKLDPLPLAQELYKILLGPVARDLPKAKAQTLMWSLDGVLRYVPVSALNDGKQYLVEQYQNVVFTPASQARLKDVPSRNWNALGLGVTKAHGDRIPALPGVVEELHGIIREAGAGKQSGILPGTIKLDEAFTQESMLAGLRQRPPVVHVASHFQFSPGNETNSALLLGDGTFLSLAQIKSLPNVFGGVELLTLSACNTATGGSGANGKEVEGFGVLAQRQGAKAVVASLWPVADRSTKLLMQEFYREREARNGESKIAALREAQLKLLRGELTVDATQSPSRQIAHEDAKPEDAKRPLFKPDPKAPFAHPYYWAPFILIGNWR